MFETVINLLLGNFLSPVILFFILGFSARLFKSDLEIPGNVSKFIAIYLMMAIGYKGGYALGQHELENFILITLMAGLALSFLLPFLAYGLLGFLSGLRPSEKAAIAGHYGSVSVVTFITATDFLASQQITYDSWMVAVMAAMETPALFACFILVNMKAQEKNKVPMTADVWKEIFLNGSVVILVGSFIIGAFAGEDGMQAVSPFFIDIFKGVLCLFMVDIGMVAASKIGNKNEVKLDYKIFAFGVLMPLVSALIGSFSMSLVGLSVGNVMLFAVLCASASYIAVPAALRIAMPNVNLSLPITLSLAITFPFNIVFGLPLYLMISKFFVGV
jgi:hypothetical protein